MTVVVASLPVVVTSFRIETATMSQCIGSREAENAQWQHGAGQEQHIGPDRLPQWIGVPFCEALTRCCRRPAITGAMALIHRNIAVVS
jgi:hypothetical protein